MIYPTDHLPTFRQLYPYIQRNLSQPPRFPPIISELQAFSPVLLKSSYKKKLQLLYNTVYLYN